MSCTCCDGVAHRTLHVKTLLLLCLQVPEIHEIDDDEDEDPPPTRALAPRIVASSDGKRETRSRKSVCPPRDAVRFKVRVCGSHPFGVEGVRFTRQSPQHRSKT